MTMQEHKMDLTGPYLVHSANIVIVAKEHDPMIINPSVLVAKNIVPADLEVVESSLSFFESKVQYEEMNGQ